MGMSAELWHPKNLKNAVGCHDKKPVTWRNNHGSKGSKLVTFQGLVKSSALERDR
jgi:hypothetical protein